MFKIPSIALKLGCDPEFFFSKNGHVLGSEKFLPKTGLKTNSQNTGVESKVTVDGVQAEINPAPQTCREDLASNISNCFRAVKETIDANKGLKVNFKPTVKVSKTEFEKLSDDSKKFGCASSQNHYTGKESVLVSDAKEDLSRSAGGHLHFGFQTNYSRFIGDSYVTGDDERIKKLLRKDTDRVVPMLDLLVGNTAVLLDRAEGNVERRKNYGRAGEFRTPKHGLEYRTLSNFWLRSYQTYSLMTGLGRYAIEICAVSTDTKKNNIEKMFMREVNMEDVRKAINENDFDLAYKNFIAIEDVISEVTDRHGHNPLHSLNLRMFHHFVAMGMDYWFKEDPMTHWLNLRNGSRKKGIGDYLNTIVRDDYEKRLKKTK